MATNDTCQSAPDYVQLYFDEVTPDKPSSEGDVTELLGQLKDKFDVE